MNSLLLAVLQFLCFLVVAKQHGMCLFELLLPFIQLLWTKKNSTLIQSFTPRYEAKTSLSRWRWLGLREGFTHEQVSHGNESGKVKYYPPPLFNWVCQIQLDHKLLITRYLPLSRVPVLSYGMTVTFFCGISASQDLDTLFDHVQDVALLELRSVSGFLSVFCKWV